VFPLGKHDSFDVLDFLPMKLPTENTQISTASFASVKKKQ